MRTATAKQLKYIDSLASQAVSFYEELSDLDPLVKEVYGCRVEELNTGQASMLIEDLLTETGERQGPLDYPSIFAAGG